MAGESRVKKSFLNARVNLIFYFITLVLSFFSRKIFLDCLGAEFIGLTGTLGNLLGFLNLAELGVGAAVAVVLYKPLFDNNKTAINEIVSVLGYLYKKIGFIILLLGVALSCFLPAIFPNTSFSYLLIYSVYFSFLASSLIGYFVNYKQALLSADQKNYVVSAYFQSTQILKTIIQMWLASSTGSFYIWLIIEFTFGVIYSIILNWKIKQVYPWLRTSIQDGKAFREKHPDVLIYTKQIFIHKIAGFVCWQVTPILIYAFASLQSVAFYGNYTTITQKLSSLLTNFLGSTSAGVGNLVAEGNNKNTLKVYWELISLRFLFTVTVAFSMYYLLPPFIMLWLGSEYLLSEVVLILILFNFLSIIRGTTDEFISAFGLFRDIWAPIVESIILLLVSVVCGSIWGLEGVLVGSVVSTFLVVFCWKPFFLFTRGFNSSVWAYWKEFAKYILVTVFSSFIVGRIVNNMVDEDLLLFNSWVQWLYSAMFITLFFFIIFYMGLLTLTKGTRDFTNRIICRIKDLVHINKG